ncbi:unnamed protein product [Merluccius merluccius]
MAVVFPKGFFCNINVVEYLAKNEQDRPILGLSLLTVCPSSELRILCYLCHVCDEVCTQGQIMAHLFSMEHYVNYYHLVECVCDGESEKRFNLCTLCQITLRRNHIINHVISFDHVYRYINTWHPTTLQSKHCYKGYTGFFKALMCNYAKQAESSGMDNNIKEPAGPRAGPADSEEGNTPIADEDGPAEHAEPDPRIRTPEPTAASNDWTPAQGRHHGAATGRAGRAGRSGAAGATPPPLKREPWQTETTLSPPASSAPDRRRDSTMRTYFSEAEVWNHMSSQSHALYTMMRKGMPFAWDRNMDITVLRQCALEQQQQSNGDHILKVFDVPYSIFSKLKKDFFVVQMLQIVKWRQSNCELIPVLAAGKKLFPSETLQEVDGGHVKVETQVESKETTTESGNLTPKIEPNSHTETAGGLPGGVTNEIKAAEEKANEANPEMTLKFHIKCESEANMELDSHPAEQIKGEPQMMKEEEAEASEVAPEQLPSVKQEVNNPSLQSLASSPKREPENDGEEARVPERTASTSTQTYGKECKEEADTAMPGKRKASGSSDQEVGSKRPHLCPRVETEPLMKPSGDQTGMDHRNATEKVLFKDVPPTTAQIDKANPLRAVTSSKNAAPTGDKGRTNHDTGTGRNSTATPHSGNVSHPQPAVPASPTDGPLLSKPPGEQSTASTEQGSGAASPTTPVYGTPTFPPNHTAAADSSKDKSCYKNQPIVGTDLLVKVTCEKRRQFYCLLCSIRLKNKDHMTSNSHRYKYMKLRYPDWMKGMSEMDEKMMLKMVTYLAEIEKAKRVISKCIGRTNEVHEGAQSQESNGSNGTPIFS